MGKIMVASPHPPSHSESMTNVNNTWDTVGEYNPNTSILKGRFYGNNPTIPMFPHLFVPTYNEDEDLVTSRWDCIRQPEWWVEISFRLSDPKSAVLNGVNIPFDAVLTNFIQENNFKRFKI